MRKDSLAFLVVGFVIGFAALYSWTKHREPQIVSATPVPFQPGQQAQSPAPPSVDMAQVRKLQDRIKSNPKDHDALIELGNINYDQRNFSDAAGFYKRALEVQDNLDVRTDLGTTLFYQDKFDEAIVELTQVLVRNPTHAQALFNLGVVMLHGKNSPEGALQAWEKLVDTNPSFPQIEAVKEQINSLKKR